ncbi:hypothetical protein BV25DRAFT_1842821 [Artomyces pyxidatus]|uniref:Uncharacterized protein n=1 Tax=Artomyces pyxidatus TaxID=48021 RepID=A0ACB8SHZ3_9AGAM|nr:hypothetical protein BV25DRAFT_1842821 [Artomyces pyxidatus]
MTGSKTQYQRHRLSRLDYQAKYNKVKRVGRRKVSKAQRTRDEQLRKLEVKGLKMPYFTSISWRTNVQDHERTLAMAAGEEEQYETWEERRFEFIERYPDAWLPHFIAALRERIEELLRTATAILTEPDPGRSPYPLDSDARTAVHTYRRLIAALHQEIELVPQGNDAYLSAMQDRALIHQGRGVHRPAFKQIYGF